MGHVIVRHGQDRDLRHGTGFAAHHARALVERGKVGIQVARKSLSAGNFAFAGAELTQRLGVRRHVRHDDEDVHPLLEGQIFGGGQRAARRQNTLDDGIIREIQEHHDLLQHAGFVERTAEVFGHVVLRAHCGEDDTELFFSLVADAGLPRDLHGKLVVLHAGAGENRQLLAANQRHKRVDRRDTGVDVVLRIDAGHGIDGRSVDVGAGDGVNVAKAVDRPSRTVKHAPEQFGGEGQLHWVALQASARVVEEIPRVPSKT